MNGILFENIQKKIGAKLVLDDVSFEVDAGCFAALLGPNGAGKSTIFNILAGLLLPDRGQVRVNGRDIDALETRREIGLVFQETTLDLDLTAEQNLRYFAGLYGLSPKASEIEALLARFGLDDRRRAAVRSFNGGHRRRLELARALLPKPSILIMDEPTVGLDPAARDSITAIAHDLASDGVAVLWITHLLDELRADDQVILLDKGKVLLRKRFAIIGGADRLKQAFAPEREAL